jgi:hypothetical protein
VAINATQTAYHLHLEVKRDGKWEIEVLYGGFDLATHRVFSPGRLKEPSQIGATGLAYAPTNPRDFKLLARELAESYRARVLDRDGHRRSRLPGLVTPASS